VYEVKKLLGRIYVTMDSVTAKASAISIIKSNYVLWTTGTYAVEMRVSCPVYLQYVLNPSYGEPGTNCQHKSQIEMFFLICVALY